MDVSIEQIPVDIEKLKQKVDFLCLPILPTRNLVLMPGATISVALLRESSIALAEYCERNNLAVGVFCQRDPSVDNITSIRQLHHAGTVADILKVLELPDGSKTALVHARQAVKMVRKSRKSINGFFCAVTDEIDMIDPDCDNDPEFVAAMDNIFDIENKIASMHSEAFASMVMTLRNDSDRISALNNLITNFPLDTNVKIRLLSLDSNKERAMRFLSILSVKKQEAELASEIMSRTHQELEQQQKRAFLQQQMEVIHNQLYGDAGNDADSFRRQIAKAGMPENISETALKEVVKLERYNPQSPDYSVIYTYLDTLLSLPWNVETELNTDFDLARKELNSEHCALDKVKTRILEQLAVLINNPGGKAPILCLVGPPGVGKTSLGESIAKALGRKYQRVSLGGLHDESEIRGHRRTYIGAMPGRIIDAVKRSGSRNPVLVLDEIDKIGADYKGDPSAAMLEVLDPEQNSHFHDNYIDVDFDLSHVLFIATANTLDTLPQPLLDRLEIVTLSGYITEEKMEIARAHLIRRNAAELGIAPDAFQISDDALTAIIERYTAESGVRQLQKALAKVARKFILAKMEKTDFPAMVLPEHLAAILGVPPYNKDKYEGNDIPGVVTGLAWTRVGGEILLVETSLSPAKQSRLSLTGNLGDVMKESVTIALNWVKSHSAELNIDPGIFEKNEINIHFPEGAVPKDGPSAGITIATALVSLLTGRLLRPRVAMTGEITLRGKVLPVGGIKEKIIAAKRAGITDIILSGENRKDIADIDSRYTAGLDFHYVTTVSDVLRQALL